MVYFSPNYIATFIHTALNLNGTIGASFGFLIKHFACICDVIHASGVWRELRHKFTHSGLQLFLQNFLCTIRKVQRCVPQISLKLKQMHFE